MVDAAVPVLVSDHRQWLVIVDDGQPAAGDLGKSGEELLESVQPGARGGGDGEQPGLRGEDPLWIRCTLDGQRGDRERILE